MKNACLISAASFLLIVMAGCGGGQQSMPPVSILPPLDSVLSLEKCTNETGLYYCIVRNKTSKELSLSWNERGGMSADSYDKDGVKLDSMSFPQKLGPNEAGKVMVGSNSSSTGAVKIVIRYKD
jgi:hypothetical protein